MAIVVFHHPFSRAATTLWQLEEVGTPYELHYVDIMKGEQKSPQMTALNRMGKLPTITDGDVVVTESAAIGLYLADRYSSGRLAPAFDDPARGTYLRWSLFPAAVIEPGALAKMNGWSYKPGQAGWGDFEAMVATIDGAIGKGPFLLGDRFTMADVILGATLRFFHQFKMLEPTSVTGPYVERLGARPALQRADAKNAAIAKEKGLG
jgi:glutathione S-transferase